MKSILNIHWKEWYWSWSSNTWATWHEKPSHWKRPCCWERLRARGEGGDREWDGWMASPTQWTWVWANSRSQWRTEESGMLQSTGSQRVRHDLVTEQQQQQGGRRVILYKLWTGFGILTREWSLEAILWLKSLHAMSTPATVKPLCVHEC